MESKFLSPALIDRRVILTMILFSVVAFFILAFNYERHLPYSPVKISLGPGPFYTQELIHFQAKAENINKKTLVWDFGDKTKQEHGISVDHLYSMPGRYTITLTVVGGRKEYKTIIIETPAVVTEELRPFFSGPRTAIVGVPVIFKDSTPNAVQWEWWFGENPTVDATTAQPSYVFRSPGRKRVILLVNGKIQGEFIVYVEAAKEKKGSEIKKDNLNKQVNIGPETKELETQLEDGEQPDSVPTGPKAPNISDKQIETMLTEFISGSKTIADFKPYLKHLNISIIYKEQKVRFHKRNLSFTSFCDELKKYFSRQKIKTLDVSDIKRDENNFIIGMTISVDRKGLG